MSFTRILIADDNNAWRRQIRSLLELHPGLRVVCEVADGVAAVQKSEELQPDLVLLDLGLPELNGIEAARQMRELARGSRILVLSQESDSSVVREALNSGALGYIHKSRMQTELFPAIDSVLAGRQFVGSSLEGYRLRDGRQAQGFHRHDIVFYSNDAVCAAILVDFTVKVLKVGKIAVIVATKPHREGFLQKVRADHADVDIDAEIQKGSCIILDSAETLRETLVDGIPDRGKLIQSIGSLIELAQRQQRTVAVCGECSPLFWAEGNEGAAIQVERLWDELMRIYGLDILCIYPLSSFQGKNNEAGLKRICAEHMASYFG